MLPYCSRKSLQKHFLKAPEGAPPHTVLDSRSELRMARGSGARIAPVSRSVLLRPRARRGLAAPPLGLRPPAPPRLRRSARAFGPSHPASQYRGFAPIQGPQGGRDRPPAHCYRISITEPPSFITMPLRGSIVAPEGLIGPTGHTASTGSTEDNRNASGVRGLRPPVGRFAAHTRPPGKGLRPLPAPLARFPSPSPMS